MDRAPKVELKKMKRNSKNTGDVKLRYYETANETVTIFQPNTAESHEKVATKQRLAVHSLGLLDNELRNRQPTYIGHIGVVHPSSTSFACLSRHLHVISAGKAPEKWTNVSKQTKRIAALWWSQRHAPLRIFFESHYLRRVFSLRFSDSFILLPPRAVSVGKCSQF
uniref:Uncharacterized protein n=1 Tax=Setaria digitata TaxID=48799 RepID=A0A915PZ64_9BILA